MIQIINAYIIYISITAIRGVVSVYTCRLISVDGILYDNALHIFNIHCHIGLFSINIPFKKDLAWCMVQDESIQLKIEWMSTRNIAWHGNHSASSKSVGLAFGSAPFECWLSYSLKKYQLLLHVGNVLVILLFDLFTSLGCSVHGH